MTTDQPSGSPSQLARPLRNPDIDPGVSEVLEPGTYVLDRFPVDLAFDIPDGGPPGWHAGTATDKTAIVLRYTPPDVTRVFAFFAADSVPIDACDAAAGAREPPIGPSVDDLVAALSTVPGLQATAPIDVTVGAFRGNEVTLTAESEPDCAEVTAFASGDEAHSFANGDTFRVQILDVAGTRIVTSHDRWVNSREPLEPDPVAEAELQGILDSIRIEPLP